MGTYEIQRVTRPELPESELAPIWQVIRPPAALYFQGKPEAFRLLDRLPEDGLGIVGTRRPQPRSSALVREIIRDLRCFPLVILSGMAKGIDATAHETAIECGLPTVAVLGTGLTQTYPEEHVSLRERILESGGLLATEFDPGLGPEAWHFIQRNRLIAGWSKATWVAEAPHRSGALNTAKWAREQHRPTYATPCFPGDAALAGNEKLLDVSDARPLWNVRSLGETWPELNAAESQRSTPSGARRASPATSDERILAGDVRLSCEACGGATVQETFNAAIARGWTPPRYFVALNAALRRGLIIEKEGALAAE